MRVLVWQESCWPSIGGIQTSAELLLHGLQERGYELAVATVAEAGLPAKSSLDGIAVHRFPFANALQERNLSQLSAIRDGVAGLKQEFAPQLVHVNGIGPSVFFHFATERVRPCPLLVTLHSSNHFTDIPHARKATLLSKTLLAADWITAVSRSMLAHGLALLPEIENRSSIVHPGTAEPTPEPAPLPFERPSILCLANLFHHKGFDLVLQAGQSLLRDRPELGIVIAGEGPAGRALRRLAAELGIGDRVKFTGQVSRQAVPSLINQATIVVVPSRREPFGLVALEAALMARPVVVADTGGLAEIVDHGKTGLVVPPDDPKVLETAIADLLGRPDAAAAMGSAARRRALADFTLERHVAAYDSLYRRLAG